MTELFLTKQQVDELTYTECQQHQKQLNKAYNFNKPLKEQMDSVWPIIDPLVNTQLWLEDRIARFEDSRIVSMNPSSDPIKVETVTLPNKTGRQARKFRIGDKIYTNIHEAVKKTGVRLNTLKTYVGRHPERYGYID